MRHFPRQSSAPQLNSQSPCNNQIPHACDSQQITIPAKCTTTRLQELMQNLALTMGSSYATSSTDPVTCGCVASQEHQNLTNVATKQQQEQQPMTGGTRPQLTIRRAENSQVLSQQQQQDHRHKCPDVSYCFNC
mmetsp:Transcript_15185/g.26784  ORF Transcript_15185/g.26784 Transcript_15185/m.26784 type:complete len:134 (+) Transcript_15185:4691-5092(+)